MDSRQGQSIGKTDGRMEIRTDGWTDRLTHAQEVAEQKIHSLLVSNPQQNLQE